MGKIKLEKTSFNFLFQGLKNVDSIQSYERLKLSIESVPKYAVSRTVNFGETVHFRCSVLNVYNITLEVIDIF